MDMFKWFASVRTYAINGTRLSVYDSYGKTVADLYRHPYEHKVTANQSGIMVFDAYDVETKKKYPMAFLPPDYPWGMSFGTYGVNSLRDDLLRYYFDTVRIAFIGGPSINRQEDLKFTLEGIVKWVSASSFKVHSTVRMDVFHHRRFGHQELLLLLEKEAHENIQERKDTLKGAEVQIYLSGSYLGKINYFKLEEKYKK